MGLILLLGGSACHPAQEPPTAWPSAGCAAEDAAEAGLRVRHQEDWLQVGPGALHLRVAVLRAPSVVCSPAVVLVPGGLQAGLPLLDAALAPTLAAEGTAVYAWDPRGRGESMGEEDANGAQGQDDLAAVLRWVASQEDVDPTQVVLYSRSFGAALAAGALARHADLAPLAWLDYEGPGWLSRDLDHAHGQSVATLRALSETAADPEAWWAEREPAGWVGAVTVPYWRAQGYPDHALGSYMQHVLAMVNGAELASEVRYNGAVQTERLSDSAARAAAVLPGLDPDGEAMVQAVRQIRAARGGATAP